MRLLNAMCTGFLAGAVLHYVVEENWGLVAVFTFGLAAGIAAMIRDKEEA